MSTTKRTWLPGVLGRRFLFASLVILAVTVVVVFVASSAMFLSDDVGKLLVILVPAFLAAAAVTAMLARPIAADANRIGEAAHRVAAGDLDARTGVTRRDELGDAARSFDSMVERMQRVERERALMLSAISHDLRTPLAALRASVEAIRDGVAGDPDRQLAGMEHQLSALSALVDDLQLHSRLVSGTLEMSVGQVDLTELVDEAIETVRPLAEHHHVQLAMDPARRVSVAGDWTQLGRVMRNLLDNAIRHAPTGSVVAVEVRHDPPLAVVRVVDDGDGFPVDLRDSAFEPFTRADPARDRSTGTAGLGLAIAKSIVTAHGGGIALGGGPGGVVEVSLPVMMAGGPDRDDV
jgi:signal transduction histidine kinase